MTVFNLRLAVFTVLTVELRILRKAGSRNQAFLGANLQHPQGSLPIFQNLYPELSPSQGTPCNWSPLQVAHKINTLSAASFVHSSTGHPPRPITSASNTNRKQQIYHLKHSLERASEACSRALIRLGSVFEICRGCLYSASFSPYCEEWWDL